MLLLSPPYLSDEIVHDILVRLPVKTLLRFKAVCKLWYVLISDPQFAKSQLHWATNRRSGGDNFNLHKIGGGALYFEWNESSLSLSLISSTDSDLVAIRKLENPFNNVQDIHVLGSCNGLLLVCLAEKDTLLWNPCTGEIKKLSWRSRIPYGRRYRRITGLGYNSSLDEYKAIMAYLAPQEITVCVCSFKAGSYSSSIKYLNDVPYSITSRVGSSSNFTGVTVNGAPHWVMSPITQHSSDWKKTIVCFDVEEESFKEVSVPDSLNAISTFHLTAVGGSLCVVVNNWKNGFAVWAMKDYGVKESWTKLFNIPIKAICLEPLAILNNSEVLIHIYGDKLMIYNLQTGKEDYIYSSQSLTYSSSVATCVESLVSPNGRGGMIRLMERSISVGYKRRREN